MTSFKLEAAVLFRGGGEMATGAAHRLFVCGFRVGVLELAQPLAIRRAVSFGSAIYEGRLAVEGVEAIKVEAAESFQELLASHRAVPVAVDPEGRLIPALRPYAVVDARMAKVNLDTRLSDACLVVALGPGFAAGRDAHALVETERGHDLGRVIWEGTAREDSGEPYPIMGITMKRVLRAPRSGVLRNFKEMGELVSEGEQVAEVEGTPVVAQVSGLVRGLLHPGIGVREGMKIGDIDPRGNGVNFQSISDKARAVGGGVLEAILSRLVHEARDGN